MGSWLKSNLLQFLSLFHFHSYLFFLSTQAAGLNVLIVWLFFMNACTAAVYLSFGCFFLLAQTSEWEEKTHVVTITTEVILNKRNLSTVLLCLLQFSFSSLLFSSLLFSSLLFSSLLFSSLLFSSLLFSWSFSHLFCSILFAWLYFALLLFCFNDFTLFLFCSVWLFVWSHDFVSVLHFFSSVGFIWVHLTFCSVHFNFVHFCWIISPCFTFCSVLHLYISILFWSPFLSSFHLVFYFLYFAFLCLTSVLF